MTIMTYQLLKMNIGNDKKAILKAFAENLMSRNV
jgi:hypothetical protein